MAVHIALHETGAPFEARPMSFATKDMQTPEFRAINPNGKVPTLLIDGRVLTEVAGCLFYLARAYPNADLIPFGDPEAEAQVVSWMSFIASAIHPARQAGMERAHEVWQIADTRLGRNDWAVGGGYSIADIHLFRLYWRIRDALKPKAGSLANIEAHYHRVMARPAVRKTIEIEEKIGYSLPR
jgi:glutathione S-transferase